MMSFQKLGRKESIYDNGYTDYLQHIFSVETKKNGIASTIRYQELEKADKPIEKWIPAIGKAPQCDDELKCLTTESG